MAEKRVPINPPSFHQQKRGPGARDEQEDEIDSFLDDLGEDDTAMMMPPDDEMGAVDLGEAGRNWTRPPVPPDFDSSPLSEHL
jgi:hypothetical protein